MPPASTRTGPTWGSARELGLGELYDAIVVGSGAGGGVVAAELAERGRSVLLLEAGPLRTAADHMRWEARATHELWWPVAFAEPAGPHEPPVPLFRGRCVGGTTTINTKVALRPTGEDFDKWHAASGLLGGGGEPFGAADLDSHFDRVERRLGVRERSDWRQCIETVRAGFDALGRRPRTGHVLHRRELHALRLVPAGLPDERGQVDAERLHPAGDRRQRARAARRRRCPARILIQERGGGAEAAGVEYVDADRRDATGPCAASSSSPPARSGRPGLLLRSGVREVAGGSASSELIGKHLGFHAARLIAGLFDEVQDAHMVYPISSHCMKFQRDADGGFLVEAATIQDPIGFATGLCDEQGLPMWGEALVEVTRRLPLRRELADDGQRRQQRDRLGRRVGPRPLLVRLDRA